MQLLHANPQYSYIAYPDGQEDTVSVRDLSPSGAPVAPTPLPPTPLPPTTTQPGPRAPVPATPDTPPRTDSAADPALTLRTSRDSSPASVRPSPDPGSPPTLRRSQCRIKPPQRLDLSGLSLSDPAGHFFFIKGGVNVMIHYSVVSVSVSVFVTCMCAFVLPYTCRTGCTCWGMPLLAPPVDSPTEGYQ